MEKMTEQEGSSLDIVSENMKALKAIFPEAFTEDGVNFEVLRQLLGDKVDEGEEKYGLNWHGKKKARQIALMPSLGTLRPCRKESVDWDTTKNLFIEGDNLEVLKLLQKSYANKVKMIYIDPPYNTGKEFIYPDKFQDNLDTYLKYTGQKDDEGFKVSSNTESSGRYHTNWLNMIYPRLKLARNLLRDDGVIFISIDDNEVANLRKLCDEIFGGENFINQISVKAKPSSGASGGGEDIKLKKNIEYLLCYCKSKSSFGRFNDVFDDKDLFGYIREYKEKGKSWKYTRVLTSLGKKTFYSEIKDGTGKPIRIFKHERVEICTLSELAKREGLSENEVHLKYFDRIFRDTNAQSSIRQRVLDATDNNDTFYSIEYVPMSGRNKDKMCTLYYKGRNKDLIAWLSDVAFKEGNRIVKKDKVGTLWDNFNWNNVSKEGDIQYPNGKKPIAFIQRMLSLCSISELDDLVLDFFAGSGSVAHAVFAQNVIDEGKRICISVQLPEPISKIDKKKYYAAEEYRYLETISDIAKERIRRAAAKIKEENPEYEGDLGFKVFKLDSSNIRAWNPNRNNLEQTILDHLEHLVKGRSEEDVLYELLLKRGVDLTVSIAEKTVVGKTVYSIGYGVLFACLDTKISREEVEDLAHGIIDWHKELKPASDTHVVFRDSAFENDIAKTNMTAILEQHGIAHVRSL